MSNVPVQLVVAAFQSEQAANDALDMLKELKKERVVGIVDAAVIRKNEDGKLDIKETADLSPGRGAARGALIGGAISLLAGPLGLVAGAGALIGGLAAKRDAGFSDERLERLGEALEPGTSAIVAIVEHTWVAELENELREAHADVTTEEIAQDIAAQLESGGEVSYTAIEGEQGAAAARVATGPTGGDMEFVAATDEGVVAGGVVVEAEVEDDEGKAGEGDAAADGEDKPAS
jgi:uncharacterized membrane protein